MCASSKYFHRHLKCWKWKEKKEAKQKDWTSRNCRQVEYASKEQLLDAGIFYSKQNTEETSSKAINSKQENTRRPLKAEHIFRIPAKKANDIIDTRNGVVRGKGQRYSDDQLFSLS